MEGDSEEKGETNASEDIPSTKSDFTVHNDGSITVDDITIPPAPTPALTCDANSARLIITKLHVRDFKSYSGTHVLGPFDKNFTCIVGPNGSGKSNVIDSLLFVFGYRAQKIRSKKISVLIHKSHKFPDLDSCSVTVHFSKIKDEGENYTTVPDSEFCVKRTGYKDNSSTYEINGKRAQYKDVANLLKGHGIDLDYNRFMILQGEIELISMMKPKGQKEDDTGMLEYIEDIIGSNRFIQPIQHFNSKLENINEIRIEKMNHLKVIEKERADAEEPRRKAMEYLQLANEVTLIENSILQAKIVLAKEEKEEKNKDKDALKEKIEGLSNLVEEYQAFKQLKEIDVKNITNEYDSHSKRVEDLKQQFKKFERDDVTCRENVKNAKEKFKKLVKAIDAEQEKVESLKKKPATLQSEIKELEAKQSKLEVAKAEEEAKLTEVMGTLKDEVQGFQEEKEAFEFQLVKLKNTVNEKKSEVDLAQSEFDLCLRSEKKEKEILSSLESDFSNCKSSAEEQKRILKEAEERLPKVESELKFAKLKYAEEEKKEGSLAEELKAKRIKLDFAKSALNASKSRSAIVQAFMEQKSKGKLTGVFGRLGDLGAIPEKYDVAISTACGSLDNIVTDTITTAQECVDFLKERKLGYATFIALDKMKKWEPYTKQKISTPENVPRLFDLINVNDTNLLSAFYFALGNTLVADDIEQATRVGLQGSTRYRVVTLKGALIDSSGTMTGGGGKALKGRMGKSVANADVSEKEIERLNAEVEVLLKNISESKKNKEELKEIIRKSESEILVLQQSMKKAKMSSQSYSEQYKMLLKQIEEQKKKVIASAPDKKQIAELEKKIEKCNNNYSKASNEAALVEDKVKGIQEKILSITKGKYGLAQKKVDKLTKEINEVSQGITKNVTLIKRTERDLKKAEDKVSSLEAEIEECKNYRENLKKEFEELEQKAREVCNEKKEAEAKLEECELKKKEILKEGQEISSKIQKVKSELIDFKNQAKHIDIELQAIEGSIKTLTANLRKLELYKIEDESTELPVLSDEEIKSVSINPMNFKKGQLQEKIKNMNPDLTAIAEYKRKEELYRQKLEDLEQTNAERDRYKQFYEQLRKHRLEEFLKGFSIISLKVKELYQMITLGGDAELELVDSLDPFSEGVEFSVRPLRKSWKNIRNLSGGEKTLSSLALVFALHFYRTTPFFVMDEIDAALDFRNVSIIGSHIRESTKNAQFIVISLRENMFQLANHLVGIYKTNNRTKNMILSSELLKRFQEEEDKKEEKKDVQHPLIKRQKKTQNKVTFSNANVEKDVGKAFDDLLGKPSEAGDKIPLCNKDNIKSNIAQSDESKTPAKRKSSDAAILPSIVDDQTEKCTSNDSFDDLLVENDKNRKDKSQDSDLSDLIFDNLLAVASTKKLDRCVTFNEVDDVRVIDSESDTSINELFTKPRLKKNEK
ncbi:structural maintenance of chromosomes protein 4-like [Uloborus diversus]|uniref:structural maintenance of chromosomes protein 4-like n=1 Tax=Uloborus diversus TaxID=327109 RepID=UPI0024099CAD|nr:structural maintenance of chromosomes protein 4-like [Uloborus diversus]